MYICKAVGVFLQDSTPFLPFCNSKLCEYKAGMMYNRYFSHLHDNVQFALNYPTPIQRYKAIFTQTQV